MNGIGSFLIGSETNIAKRNVLWNMAGSFIYALTSMLLGAVVTRTLGAASGGIFFFAFSTFGQQIFIVAYFGMRPVQVTDAGEQGTFGEYRAFRLFSCAAAVLATLLYGFLLTAPGEARTVLFLTAGYKILDGFADCYDSEFQRQGRLYLAGKSNAFRTLGSVALFLLLLFTTRSLPAACLAALIGQAGMILLCCVAPLRCLPKVRTELRRGYIRRLFAKSRWLFLGAFLDLYIFAASKYAVNRYLTAADNSYYTTIFIPTSVINLMSNFVIRPVLTLLSEAREAGRKAVFLSTVGKITALILGLTFLGTLAAWFLGIPVLSLLVGAEAGKALKGLRTELLLVILGGGFYALLNLLYYCLVILERQRSIFLIYVLGTGLAWVSAEFGVRYRGLLGGALSYCGMMALLTLLFAAATLRALRQDHKFKGEA